MQFISSVLDQASIQTSKLPDNCEKFDGPGSDFSARRMVYVQQSPLFLQWPARNYHYFGSFSVFTDFRANLVVSAAFPAS